MNGLPVGCGELFKSYCTAQSNRMNKEVDFYSNYTKSKLQVPTLYLFAVD